MTISNVTGTLEAKYARYQGEIIDTKLALKTAQAAWKSIPALQSRLNRLEKLVASCIDILRDVDPDWRPERVRAIKKNQHNSPIPFGEASRMALTVMRELTQPNEGMKVREIAEQMLKRAGVSYDRPMLDGRANALSNYLKKHKGDLVESDEQMPARWWVIR